MIATFPGFLEHLVLIFLVIMGPFYQLLECIDACTTHSKPDITDTLIYQSKRTPLLIRIKGKLTSFNDFDL